MKRDSRTDIAKSVLVIAQRVIDNVAAGRIYPAQTVEWAKAIVRANAEPAARARFPAESTTERSQ